MKPVMPNPFTLRTGVIAGGSWIVDRVKVVDSWPAQDALATILSETTGNGGSAYNLLKNLSRLGATFPLHAIGLVGTDDAGRAVMADCHAHRIDTAQLRTTDKSTTSYTDVMTEQSTRRRTFFHHRGANTLLASQDFDFSRSSAKIFHLGYLLLLDALDAPGDDGRPQAWDVLRRAREAGLLTSLDCVSENTNRFETVVAPVLPQVDILFANDFEAEKLTGLTLGRGTSLDRPAVEAAARALLTRGVQQWAIVHMPAGACACSAEGAVHWQEAVALPTAEITGTAGAGDAFAAGVLFGLHETWPIARALELGVCAAAASLRHPTCSETVVSSLQCLALGRMHGFRPMT